MLGIAVHSEHFALRVHEPVVRHSIALKYLEFRHNIVVGIRAREHLANPVRPRANRAADRPLGHPCAPPSHKVRAINLVPFDLDVDLGQDPPTSRWASTARTTVKIPA